MNALNFATFILLGITAVFRAATIYYDWKLIAYEKRTKAEVLGEIATLGWMVVLTGLLAQVYLGGIG